jgi:hypothetical protein
MSRKRRAAEKGKKIKEKRKRSESENAGGWR